MQTPTPTITLITGANKGIGLETARQLGKAGHLVLLGARNPTLGEATAATLRKEGIEVRFIELDVCNPTTIQAAATEIESTYGRLDVLINNAGISDSSDGLPSKTSLDAVRRIYDVNVFGVLAVTQAMLPLLRKSASARIVNVSSRLGSLTYNSDPSWEHAAVKITGYNTSKAALNMLTVVLAAELRDEGIKVNSVCPGYTATDLNGNRGTQTVSEGAFAPVRLARMPDDGPTGCFFSSLDEEPW